MRKYSGQAIAIIMVVLVVATVIGASLFSRVVKNREALVETRESSRALEQADSILDFFISADLEALEKEIDLELNNVEDATEIVEATTVSQIVGFFPSISDDIISADDWCDGQEAVQDSLKIKIQYADEGDPVSIKVGDVFAFKPGKLSSALPEPTCTLTYTFYKIQNTDSVFTTKAVYISDSTSDIRPYEIDDMKVYCFDSDNNGACSGDIVSPDSSLTGTLSEGGVVSFELKTPPYDGYSYYEVRLIPLSGDMKASKTIVCGDLQLNDYKINAQVNCNGDYREKQVILPNVKTLGYLPLFDYTIYNADGTLKPYN